MKNWILILGLFWTIPTFGQWEKIYSIDTNSLGSVYATPYEQVFLTAQRGDILYLDNSVNDFTIGDLNDYGLSATVVFEDEKVGYAGSGCYYTTLQCPPNTIFKTEDGGHTWQQVFQTGSTGIFHSIIPLEKGKILAISDFDGLYASEDKGHTWKKKPLEFHQGNGVIFKMKFIDKRIGFLIHQTFTAANGRKTILYKSSDAGDTWTKVHESSNEVGVIDFYFTSTHRGYLLLKNGILLRTTNGGSTWESIDYSPNVTDDPQKLFFVSSSIGYISSFDRENRIGYIYRTTDGGNTWIEDLKIDNQYIGDMYFTNSGTGYAIVEYSNLFKRKGEPIIEKPNFNLKLFPNPVKEQFEVQVSDLPVGNNTLRVMNSLGQLLFETIDFQKPIDTRILREGIYFVELRSNNGTLIGRTKFIKQ